MLKRIFLPTILIILGYGFWISPNFKEISAGVAIFLFGMIALEEGFKAFSGGTLEKVLKKSTDKLSKSIGFGFVATAMMQSSSLVSVLTISFLGAGLIGLFQGVGIIYGANIGTTTGAWLMAGFGLKIHIAQYAMPMLVFGIILIFQKAKSLKGFGYILAGLGFLFLGIHYMKEGFEAFKDTIDLAAFAVPGFKGIIIFIGIGVLATVIMQSSHATIVLILAALAANQITYENAIALVIGANIGTTITAILGSLSSNIDGKRLAGAHLIFNVVTAVIAVAIMHQMMSTVDFISDHLGIASDNHTLRLAVFDSLFKIMGVVIFIPFTQRLVDFLQTAIKSNKKKEGEFEGAKYLNDSVLELPATAMLSLIKETKHLYENAFEIIAHGLNLKRSNIVSTRPLEEIVMDPYSKKIIDIDDFYRHRIKGLYGEIIDFSAKAQSYMSTEDIQKLYKLKLANRDIVEAVKDTHHLQKNLIKYSTSENEHIKEKYNNIRVGLAELLRNIDKLSKMMEEDEILLLLSKVKVHMERYDILANGTLDNLIRNNLITNEMATSLMNDSAYAYKISQNFIAMAEILFIDFSSDIKDLAEEFMVNDEDVDLILKEERA
ncbi:Na/Pi cotransporter family protein [Sulfurovum sp. NBC37-1]|uniref:Na/Pi cotransporter family protein n=1 Tax=Sulfurovum sp. (strain NBC37-1) TaxID=387093 RepID=UPI000158748D|nr:Na/Pi symporter [Sulfurovum sp. NBC37-1]BAF72077.1 phosphate:Na+ symporter [Sulfurovum sp. NBC37-1]